MIKKSKKVLALSLLLTGILSSAAFAATKSTSNFTYGPFTAKGTLTGEWHLGSTADIGTARTDRVSDLNYSYQVTSYVESQDSPNGDRTDQDFDNGYTWAQAEVSRKGVWRFNSTHGIADANNIWVAQASRTLTDW